MGKRKEITPPQPQRGAQSKVGKRGGSGREGSWVVRQQGVSHLKPPGSKEKERQEKAKRRVNQVSKEAAASEK